MERTRSGEYLKALSKARGFRHQDIADRMQEDFPGYSPVTLKEFSARAQRRGTELLYDEHGGRILRSYLKAVEASQHEIMGLYERTPVLDWRLLRTAITSPGSSAAGRYRPVSSAGTHSAP